MDGEAVAGNPFGVWSQNLKDIVTSIPYFREKPLALKSRIACFVLGIAVACAIASCATYSKVGEKRPRFIPAAGGSGAIATAEAKITKGLQADRHDPLVALGEYMTAAEIALGQLERDPNDVNALRDYNFAVARIIAVIDDAKLDPWTQPLSVPASGGALGVERRVRESVGRSIRIRRVWRTTRCYRVSGSLASVGVSSTRREQPESTAASRKRRLRKQFIKAAQVVPFCSPNAQTQLTAIKISFSISLGCAYKDS
jgi:hypothetical protein